jgi:large subunit ribosomal protein L13
MTTQILQPKIRQYTFDAQGEKLGRFASKVAIHLRGKMEPSFASNKLPRVHVTIKNIEKLGISDKKLGDNVVIKYTGYHGGLKTKSWSDSYASNPRKFFMRTLRYMLPKNKQSSQILKFVKFE